MRSFNNLISDGQLLVNDSSGSTTALLEILVNQGIKKFLNLEDWTFNKDSVNYSTGTGVQYLDSSYNANEIDFVYSWYGNLWYVPTEVKTATDWQILNQTTVSSSLITHYFVDERTKQIGLFPVPVDSQGTIKVGFTKKIIDYSASDYSTGTVSVSANGTIFSGKNTSWGSQMAGRYIQPTGTNTPADDFWFEIQSVGSTGSIYTREIVPNAITGATYTVSQLMPFPEGFEQTPLWYSLDKYYQMKEKPALAREYERMWKEDLENLYRRDQRSVTGLVKKTTPYSQLDVNQSPWNITLYE